MTDDPDPLADWTRRLRELEAERRIERQFREWHERQAAMIRRKVVDEIEREL
jgi:hypothetical protein